MTAEIVNLKQFKKQKARAEKEKQAQQNRVSFGRNKTEKSLTDALNSKARKALDDKKIEDRDD
jgi:hypothetical protein